MVSDIGKDFVDQDLASRSEAAMCAGVFPGSSCTTQFSAVLFHRAILNLAIL
jgi:hypothetical protein